MPPKVQFGVRETIQRKNEAFVNGTRYIVQEDITKESDAQGSLNKKIVVLRKINEDSLTQVYEEKDGVLVSEVDDAKSPNYREAFIKHWEEVMGVYRYGREKEGNENQNAS